MKVIKWVGFSFVGLFIALVICDKSMPQLTHSERALLGQQHRNREISETAADLASQCAGNYSDLCIRIRAQVKYQPAKTNYVPLHGRVVCSDPTRHETCVVDGDPRPSMPLPHGMGVHCTDPYKLEGCQLVKREGAKAVPAKKASPTHCDVRLANGNTSNYHVDDRCSAPNGKLQNCCELIAKRSGARVSYR